MRQSGGLQRTRERFVKSGAGGAQVVDHQLVRGETKDVSDDVVEAVRWPLVPGVQNGTRRHMAQAVAFAFHPGRTSGVMSQVSRFQMRWSQNSSLIGGRVRPPRVRTETVRWSDGSSIGALTGSGKAWPVNFQEVVHPVPTALPPSGNYVGPPFEVGGGQVRARISTALWIWSSVNAA